MAAIPSRPSRKGKKAWRHNIDISAITSGLDAARAEIIDTGGIIAEQDADQLFATDVIGDVELARKQQGKKLLKAEEILALRSAVPGLEGRKRKGEDAASLVPTPGAKRVRSGTYIPRRELLRLRAVADMADGGLRMYGDSAAHDPWALTVGIIPAEYAHLDFLEPAQAPHEPKTLKHAPISLTANGKTLPAVRKPDAGKSYNPLVGDWSTLLAREGAKAVEAEQKRLAAEAAAEENEAILLAEAQAVEAREREEGGTDYESEWEGIMSEAEETIIRAGKVRGRKTPAERNKVRARKEREGAEKMARKQREREAQERRITEIIRESKKNDVARSVLVQQRASGSDSDSSADMDVPLRRRKMGQLPVPRAPLEVVLPDELQDSLRRLKPEGNLLTDRYRNALVSGMVEATRSRQKKMAKVETREKWSYKDWVLR